MKQNRSLAFVFPIKTCLKGSGAGFPRKAAKQPSWLFRRPTKTVLLNIGISTRAPEIKVKRLMDALTAFFGPQDLAGLEDFSPVFSKNKEGKRVSK